MYLQEMVKSGFVERHVALPNKVSVCSLSDPDNRGPALCLEHTLYGYVVIFRTVTTLKKREKMCLQCYHLFKKKGGTKHIYVFAYILLKYNKR